MRDAYNAYNTFSDPQLGAEIFEFNVKSVHKKQKKDYSFSNGCNSLENGVNFKLKQYLIC